MKPLSSIALALSLAVIATTPGCSCGDDFGAADAGVGPDAGPADAGVTWADCYGGDDAFVRNAYLAVLGARPRSQAEVNVYTDLMREIRRLSSGESSAMNPREVVVRALAARDGYRDRWVDVIMDALKVTRIEDQSQDSCYGIRYRADDSGTLAAFVRDNPANGGGDGNGRFSMLDLLRSSLALDDLTPVYRAHLYSLVSRPIPAANVPRIEAELARREDFGLVFDAAYLNRDIVCLGCHNSEDSITFNPDPALNRHWAVPGLFEKAIYTDSFGIDVTRAHAPFRYDGFVSDLGDGGQLEPWGWSDNCGAFDPNGLGDDPADIDALFAGMTGKRLTVIDLEAALNAGFDSLATTGLQRDADNEISDPDQAFAYLVAMAIVEQVWIQIIGTPLTIANYFPRNEASRDLLSDLTESFVASRYSLEQLVVDVTQTPYFNVAPAEQGCEAPYAMPNVYDPWVISDEDETRRLNGAGDAVTAVSGRTLLRTANRALRWPQGRFESFPELPSEVFICDQFFGSCSSMGDYCATNGGCCFAHDYLCVNPPGPDEPSSEQERNFQRGVGAFLKNGERGFLGLDFQARLLWEDRFATCTNPLAPNDFVGDMIVLATQRNATVGDIVSALKDRFVGESSIATEAGPAGVSETEAIEAIFGVSLDTPALSASNLEKSARKFCGVLVSSPQFLLGGMAGRGSAGVPLLTPDDASYATVCGDLEGLLPDGSTLTCGDNSVTVTP